MGIYKRKTNRDVGEATAKAEGRRFLRKGSESDNTNPVTDTARLATHSSKLARRGGLISGRRYAQEPGMAQGAGGPGRCAAGGWGTRPSEFRAPPRRF